MACRTAPLLLLATAATAWAVDPPATAPVAGASLQQLSDQTQRLYAGARLGMVRVRLPTPPWLARDNHLRQLQAKWGSRLDPDVQNWIAQERQRAALAAAQTPSTTGPTAAARVTAAPTDRVLIATGLLVDGAGHAVLPLYVDPSDLPAGSPPTLAALTGDGRPTTATFVGSDYKTKLTVLKLANVGGGSPAALAGADADADRPADGSLAMVVAPDGSARLAVWTNAVAEVGLVVRPDGTFAGFGFAEDFLSAATAKPIVDQLVATGTVRRPVLGVHTGSIRRDELFGLAPPPADGGGMAAGPGAILIVAVDAGSPADRGQLRPGDVILAIGGRPVGPRSFAAVIAACRGDTVLQVRRGPDVIERTVVLRLE